MSKGILNICADLNSASFEGYGDKLDIEGLSLKEDTPIMFEGGPVGKVVKIDKGIMTGQITDDEFFKKMMKLQQSYGRKQSNRRKRLAQCVK